MDKDFIAAIHALASEKGLDIDIVLSIVEVAIATAYRKEYGSRDQRYEAKIDFETGSMQIFLIKTVIDDDIEEYDNQIEISLHDARMMDKEIEVDGILSIDVTPDSQEYGRIAAQSAKQVILQKIQEAEREKMYVTFKEREDEIIIAKVAKINTDKVIVEIEGNMVILVPQAQIPGEKYFQGQLLKIYLERVAKTSRGPELRISRKHPRLIVKLFEQEIPEIQEGTVEVKGIARQAGVRSKVVVASNDESIDPVGACIGQKGMRIASVLNEVGHEKVDVIEWADNPERYLRNALEPAHIEHIDFVPNQKRAVVYVQEDQRAIAVGKRGQNVNLASQLTGWIIDLEDATSVGTLEDVESEKVSANTLKSKVSRGFFDMNAAGVSTIDQLGFSEKVRDRLEEAGMNELSDLYKVDVEWLSQVKGISAQMAEELISFLEEVQMEEKKKDKKSE
jgi:transcription termination/antitermination protein NusA